ncbi:hypothetical protein CEXT_606861 [Caerostris extrusa]|uniref:Uncharacterized protein n=1 Tax=Caerostris extrusa TaxID=172846 RepID=A0AAV4RYV9_CAEEX|nr:hypothetical protein CEXT_606861 [Caerostris extrusa]
MGTQAVAKTRGSSISLPSEQDCVRKGGESTKHSVIRSQLPSNWAVAKQEASSVSLRQSQPMMGHLAKYLEVSKEFFGIIFCKSDLNKVLEDTIRRKTTLDSQPSERKFCLMF